MIENLYASPVTTARVCEIHRRVIAECDGVYVAPGEDCLNCVEGAIGSAVTSSCYQCDVNDPDVADALTTAGYLLINLVRNHCFVDGNKRAAWSVFVEMIQRNLVTVDATEDEAVSFVNAVAVDHLGIEAVMEWAATRLREPAYDA